MDGPVTADGVAMADTAGSTAGGSRARPFTITTITAGTTTILIITATTITRRTAIGVITAITTMPMPIITIAAIMGRSEALRCMWERRIEKLPCANTLIAGHNGLPKREVLFRWRAVQNCSVRRLVPNGGSRPGLDNCLVRLSMEEIVVSKWVMTHLKKVSRNRYLAAGRRVFDGVVEQVCSGLRYQMRIAQDKNAAEVG